MIDPEVFDVIGLLNEEYELAVVKTLSFATRHNWHGFKLMDIGYQGDVSNLPQSRRNST